MTNIARVAHLSVDAFEKAPGRAARNTALKTTGAMVGGAVASTGAAYGAWKAGQADVHEGFKWGGFAGVALASTAAMSVLGGRYGKGRGVAPLGVATLASAALFGRSLDKYETPNGGLPATRPGGR